MSDMCCKQCGENEAIEDGLCYACLEEREAGEADYLGDMEREERWLRRE